MMKIFIPCILALGLLSGCQSTPMETAEEEQTIHKETATVQEDKKRVKVNDEMLPHIEAGENFFNQWRKDKREDYDVLANTLRTHQKAFIKSCTMRGESHDKLHSWLEPHMRWVEELEGRNPDEALDEIRRSFDDFHKRFE